MNKMKIDLKLELLYLLCSIFEAILKTSNYNYGLWEVELKKKKTTFKR